MEPEKKLRKQQRLAPKPHRLSTRLAVLLVSDDNSDALSDVETKLSTALAAPKP